jgi:excisionase family DNA binding protein
MVELKEKLYTSTQVADILGVSLRTLYRYMEDGKIQSMRTASGRHRFTRENILEFLNAGGAGQIKQDEYNFNQRGQQNYSNQGFQTQNIQPQYNREPQWPQNQPPNPRPNVNDYYNNQSNQYQNPIDTRTNINNNQNYPQEPLKREDPMATRFGPNNINKYNIPDIQSDSQDNKSPTNDLNFNDKPLKENEFQKPKFSNFDFYNDDDDYISFSKPKPAVDNDTDQPTTLPNTGQAEKQDHYRSPFDQPLEESTQKKVQLDEVKESEVPKQNFADQLKYYKSAVNDLIELARRIKDISSSRDLDYAFTMYAGLSLHFLVRPFEQLHIYMNPEDMNTWREVLRLSESSERESDLIVYLNSDIIFVPNKTIGGFKVVEDRVLLQDLSRNNELDLVRQFRTHISNI